jgi:hypothetical protein
MRWGGDGLDFECVACAAHVFFDVVTYRLAYIMVVISTDVDNMPKLMFWKISILPLLYALRFARRFEASAPRDKSMRL